MSASNIDVFSLAAYGEIDSLKYAIDTDRSLLDAHDSFGLTPLHEASRHEQSHCVAYLLSEGASPTDVDASGQTALHFACGAGSVECTSLLLSNCSDLVNMADVKGRTALHLASSLGHDRCVALLLKHGANAKLCDNAGTPALSWVSSFKGFSPSSDAPSPDVVVREAIKRGECQSGNDDEQSPDEDSMQ
jgi:ankyrin repeat protein